MEKYNILNKVGTGSTGVTFKVVNKETGEVCAMKCIPRGGRIEHVEREIMNHRVLHHPNVIQFKEVVLDDTKLGIVMEFAEGGDLGVKVLLDGAFGEAEVRKMFQKLIVGVSYIHHKRICHRNLTLHNILLASNDGLKICGFACSKSLSLPHSRCKSRVGSPSYIAPEVLSGQEYDGKLADVWSCGVSLYTMLTREHPIKDVNVAKSKILQHVSEECKDLLTQIFVDDPKKRITIEKIKEHPWYLKDLPDDLKEAQADLPDNQNETSPCQRKEDIDKIIEQAKIIKTSILQNLEEATASTAAEDVKMKRAKLTPPP